MIITKKILLVKTQNTKRNETKHTITHTKKKSSQSKTVKEEKWDKRTTKCIESNTMATANPSFKTILFYVRFFYLFIFNINLFLFIGG